MRGPSPVAEVQPWKQQAAQSTYTHKGRGGKKMKKPRNEGGKGQGPLALGRRQKLMRA